MEQKLQVGRRFGTVLSEPIWIVFLVLASVIIGFSIAGYVFRWEWTGVIGTQDKGLKTLWHWLDLLIIPGVLAAGALLFKRSDAKNASYIADQRAQEYALEAYFDRMSELLLDKDDPLLASSPDSPCHEMASTRTLTVLRRLDANRRNQVFQFLRDARLLGVKSRNKDKKTEPIAVFPGRNMREMELQDAILKGADLSGAVLAKANLERANLNYADLSEADLKKGNFCRAWFASANLEGACLMKADLRRAFLAAVLRGAKFYKANLRGANLYAADMRDADLRKANLREANLKAADMSNANLRKADLREANLREAKNLSCEKLLQAKNWDQAYRDEALSCGKETPTPPKT